MNKYKTKNIVLGAVISSLLSTSSFGGPNGGQNGVPHDYDPVLAIVEGATGQTYAATRTSLASVAQSLGADPEQNTIHWKLTNVQAQLTAFANALGSIYYPSIDMQLTQLLDSRFRKELVIDSVDTVFDTTGSTDSSHPALLTNGTWDSGTSKIVGAAPEDTPRIIRANGRLLEVFSATATPRDDDYYRLTPGEKVGIILQAVFNINDGDYESIRPAA